MCRQGIDDIIITLNLQDDKMRNQVSPPPCTDVDIWPIDFARWLCSTATIHIWLHVSERHHRLKAPQKRTSSTSKSPSINPVFLVRQASGVAVGLNDSNKIVDHVSRH